MTPNKKKAAAGFCSCAASKIQSGRNHSIRPRIRAAIERLALWGLLPVKLAEWLIQRGGLRHV